MTCRRSSFAAEPFILRFAERVEPLPAPAFRYDSATQCEDVEPLSCGGTQRGRSYQNSTSAYSVLTGYEDYDDEYVVERD